MQPRMKPQNPTGECLSPLYAVLRHLGPAKKNGETIEAYRCAIDNDIPAQVQQL